MWLSEDLVAFGENAEGLVLPPEAMVKSQPLLLLRAMNGSKATQWKSLVVMSVAHITTRDPENLS